MSNVSFISKVNKKISELEVEKTKLIEKLEKERDTNIWAWNAYGSELCVMEMERNELKIQEAIEKVREDIKLLRSTLVNNDNERTLAKEAKRISGAIKALETIIKKLNENMALEKSALDHIKHIQKLLDII